MHASAFQPRDFANGVSKPVWSIFASLRKDAHLRPAGIVPRMSCTVFNLRVLDLMKKKNDLKMRKQLEANESFFANLVF
jgi:hypothetical protein